MFAKELTLDLSSHDTFTAVQLRIPLPLYGTTLCLSFHGRSGFNPRYGSDGDVSFRLRLRLPLGDHPTFGLERDVADICFLSGGHTTSLLTKIRKIYNVVYYSFCVSCRQSELL